jgi:hypothetical protein
MATFPYATNFGSKPGPTLESAWKPDPARRNFYPMHVLFNLNTFSWKTMQRTAGRYAAMMKDEVKATLDSACRGLSLSR